LDRSPGGLGIGLTLVKRLAELHGGTAEAFSDGERRGSSFVIRIPQIAPPSTSARAGTEEALRIGSPRRVLIVEDNADAREGLCQLLQLWNFEVHEAVDGPSGVEKAEAARPDVVLVDIGLPGFDGFEVARRIRSHFGVSRIRLIAVTGYAQSEYQQRAQEAGFDEYLVKPVAADKLIHLIGLRAHH
jgi:CheY-like chemotaxis protein